MEVEDRQEELIAIVGSLSAIDTQLQQVEETAEERSDVFGEKAEASDTPTSPQFFTAKHLLQELQTEVHEIREYINDLEEFLRTGRYDEDRHSDVPRVEEGGLLDRTRMALKKANTSFQKASDALHVVGRALEKEGLKIYADHVQNLSKSMIAEAQRAQSVLESTEPPADE